MNNLVIPNSHPRRVTNRCSDRRSDSSLGVDAKFGGIGKLDEVVDGRLRSFIAGVPGNKYPMKTRFPARGTLSLPTVSMRDARPEVTLSSPKDVFLTSFVWHRIKFNKFASKHHNEIAPDDV